MQPAAGTTSYQRFRYCEKRLNAGVRWTLNRSCTFDLSGGYAFDRNYNRGGGSSVTGADGVSVMPGPYVSRQVHLRW